MVNLPFWPHLTLSLLYQEETALPTLWTVHQPSSFQRASCLGRCRRASMWCRSSVSSLSLLIHECQVPWLSDPLGLYISSPQSHLLSHLLDKLFWTGLSTSWAGVWHLPPSIVHQHHSWGPLTSLAAQPCHTRPHPGRMGTEAPQLPKGKSPPWLSPWSDRQPAWSSFPTSASVRSDDLLQQISPVVWGE